MARHHFTFGWKGDTLQGHPPRVPSHADVVGKLRIVTDCPTGGWSQVLANSNQRSLERVKWYKGSAKEALECWKKELLEANTGMTLTVEASDPFDLNPASFEHSAGGVPTGFISTGDSAERVVERANTLYAAIRERADVGDIVRPAEIMGMAEPHRWTDSQRDSARNLLMREERLLPQEGEYLVGSP